MQIVLFRQRRLHDNDYLIVCCDSEDAHSEPELSLMKRNSLLHSQSTWRNVVKLLCSAHPCIS